MGFEGNEKEECCNVLRRIRATICTVSMLLPIIIGTAGAAAVGSMSGMSQSPGNAGPTAYWAIVNAINSFGQPLLIGSIVLILYGLKDFGRLPVAITAIGGILLYASMYLLGMSLPLIAISASILAVAYGIAYGPLIKRRTSQNSK